MKHSTVTARSFFLTVFWSPIERLESAKAIALVAGFFQYLTTDAFAGAFCLVFVAGVADYVIGVRTAKLLKTYSPVLAQTGWLGKMCGFCFIWLIRGLEFYIRGQGGPDFHGAFATGAALSLFAVDLSSIAHHREELGASKIPFWDDLIGWVNRFAKSKLPPDPAALARRAEDPKP